MNKYVLLLVFCVSFSASAQVKLTENENGVLTCWWRDSLAYTDTVIKGMKSRLYEMPCFERDHWIYVSFPDGVEIVVEEGVKFPYPSGLKPGIYNFAKLWVDVTKDKNNEAVFTLKGWEVPQEQKPTQPPASLNPPSHLLPTVAPRDCMYKGYNMTAKVKVVPVRADLKVKVVEQGEDLTVKIVTNSLVSNLCGQWTMVDFGEDFTVQFVEGGEDIKIRIVN